MRRMSKESTMTVISRSPADCSDATLRDIAALAAEGGEVEAEDIAKGIRRAEALLWVAQGESICAVAALKRPHASYRQRVFKNAGSAVRPELFPYELGYIFVEEATRDRKFARSLAIQALQVAGEHAVYATTRSDNAAMQHILTSLGFMRCGEDYQSKRTDSFLSLFTHSRTHL